MTTFSYEANRQKLLAHYLCLATTPGWEKYVKKRVESMAKAIPELYGDFPEKVDAALAALPAPSLSATDATATSTQRA